MRRTSTAFVVLVLAAVLPAAAGAQGAKPDSAARDTAQQAADTGALTLVREVFAYEGAGRDPFQSLLKSGDVRPLIADLKLVAIYYDTRSPARSVAVLRDITTSKSYRAKPGDVLGRLRITTIRPRDVVFTVQEFGYERQETLSLKTQEETP